MSTNNPQVLPPTELHLTAPKEMTALSTGSDGILVSAQEFQIASEPSFQVADELQVRLRAEAKQINDKRLEFTRPIDAIKDQWIKFFQPAVNARNQAATIYQQKMSEFRAEKRREAEAAQRKAEQELADRKAHEEAEARKLEERAAKLKTPARADALMREADAIRQTSAMMPESVALAAAAPQTVASNVAEIWEVEKIDDMPAYLRWLANHPEWHEEILNFKAAGHNRLAKQFHVIGVPGVRFKQRDSFRSKPGRR